MTAINLTDIEQDLDGYLRRVQMGESFLILDNDQPVAQVTPIAPAKHGLRPEGLCAGEFVTPDDFNDPQPDDLLRELEGR